MIEFHEWCENKFYALNFIIAFTKWRLAYFKVIYDTSTLDANEYSFRIFPNNFLNAGSKIPPNLDKWISYNEKIN